MFWTRGRGLPQGVRRKSSSTSTLIGRFHFNPEIPKAKILDLATCSFVECYENVLLVGRTGVGKSHIAQALGHRACRAGYHALCTSAHEMRAGPLAGPLKIRVAAVVSRPLR